VCIRRPDVQATGHSHRSVLTAYRDMVGRSRDKRWAERQEVTNPRVPAATRHQEVRIIRSGKSTLPQLAAQCQKTARAAVERVVRASGVGERIELSAKRAGAVTISEPGKFRAQTPHTARPAEHPVHISNFTRTYKCIPKRSASKRCTDRAYNAHI
jgi:hypothetical protein